MHIFDIYQKNGLIPPLGGSDDIHTKIKQSAEDIAEHLAKTPTDVIPYTLVALDNNIGENEPVLTAVEKMITGNNWQAVRSQFPEMPISLYRAVILQGLENLMNNEPALALVIWWAGVDVYPHLDIPHKEKTFLSQFFNEVGDNAEAYAAEEWTVSEKEDKTLMPKLKVEFKNSESELNLSLLTNRLSAASGKNGKNNQTLTNANPYWPNQAQHWSYEFAPRAAQGIKDAVDKALTEQSKLTATDLNKLQTDINAYFTKVDTKIKQKLAKATQSALAVERRSQLLWWKETLYSKTLKKSYRDLSKFESAIAMAVDLQHLLPKVFPISVDFILKETYGQIHGRDKETIKLIDFLKEIDDLKNKNFLSQFFEEGGLEGSRTTLSDFISKIIFSKIDVEKEVSVAIGVSAEKTITYEDLSVWILHGLAAAYFVKK